MSIRLELAPTPGFTAGMIQSTGNIGLITTENPPNFGNAAVFFNDGVLNIGYDPLNAPPDGVPVVPLWRQPWRWASAGDMATSTVGGENPDLDWALFTDSTNATAANTPNTPCVPVFRNIPPFPVAIRGGLSITSNSIAPSLVGASGRLPTDSNRIKGLRLPPLLRLVSRDVYFSRLTERTREISGYRVGSFYINRLSAVSDNVVDTFAPLQVTSFTSGTSSGWTAISFSLLGSDSANRAIVWFGVLNSSQGYTNSGYLTISSTGGPLLTSLSDHRMKTNVRYLEGARDLVDRLRPRLYRHILSPDHEIQGFVAHELQAEIPSAVSGSKDQVDSDGQPVYQMVGYRDLVPWLTGAAQELAKDLEDMRRLLAGVQ